jgi:hypothetical protein
LFEAINSMFAWYESSKVCYAYLDDVHLENDNDFVDDGFEYAFVNAKWYTRGWTLQELIAPHRIIFLNSNWNEIGTKMNMRTLISRRTKIPEATLLKPNDVYFNSVACRMSWASSRQTTKMEDMAYCLLGIFGVNMPLLYGEGERAFERLQIEIMKNSADQSLFAWGTEFVASTPGLQTHPAPREGSIFARSPYQFLHSRYIRPSFPKRISPPFAMTNKGLEIQLPLLSGGEGLSQSEFYALLECVDERRNTMFLAMVLRGLESEITFDRTHIKQRNGKEYYGRSTIELPMARVVDAVTKKVYIRGSNLTMPASPAQIISLVIRDSALDALGLKFAGFHPPRVLETAGYEETGSFKTVSVVLKHDSIIFFYQRPNSSRPEISVTVNGALSDTPSITVSHAYGTDRRPRSDSNQTSDVVWHMPSPSDPLKRVPVKATVERRTIVHHTVTVITITQELG